MDAILEIAQKHNLKVVEDCAHAIETTYHNVGAGLIGDAGCFSFYPTKSITTGDGGMVISRNRELIERVKLLSYNGVATSAWTRFAGDVAGYEVRAAGYKYNMTDMEAALGLPQLPFLEERRAKREQLWRAYDEGLKGLPVILPSLGDSANRHAFHLYTPFLQLEKLSVGREPIVAAMEAENIGVGIHYEPVHVQPFWIDRFGARDGDFPNATYIGERTISLPLSAGMTQQDVSDVCKALRRDFALLRGLARRPAVRSLGDQARPPGELHRRRHVALARTRQHRLQPAFILKQSAKLDFRSRTQNGREVRDLLRAALRNVFLGDLDVAIGHLKAGLGSKVIGAPGLVAVGVAADPAAEQIAIVHIDVPIDSFLVKEEAAGRRRDEAIGGDAFEPQVELGKSRQTG